MLSLNPCFFLLIVACIYTCLYIHIFLNTACSLFIMFLVNLLPKLTIWYWISNWYACPWEDCFSHCQQSSLSHSCVRLSPFGLSIIYLGMSIDLIQFIFRQSCCWDFMSVNTGITRRYRFTANALVLWKLHSLSAPSAAMFPKP